MGVSRILDKRLQQRMIREGRVSGEELKKELDALPDLAESVGEPVEEESEKLREELLKEHEIRTERIERALNEPEKLLPPPPPPTPFEVE